MFFQIDLEKNSSSPEGAVFSRPDVPGSGTFETLEKKPVVNINFSPPLLLFAKFCT